MGPVKKTDIIRRLYWESSHWQPAISLILSEVVGHHLISEHVPMSSKELDWNEVST